MGKITSRTTTAAAAAAAAALAAAAVAVAAIDAIAALGAGVAGAGSVFIGGCLCLCSGRCIAAVSSHETSKKGEGIEEPGE